MEKKIITIDIIQNVLQASAAVGPYRGKEVSDFLEHEVEKITSKSVLVIDIRKALPLQYVFCQYAFGPLLKSLQEGKSLPTVFKMHEHHKQCFFRGIIKYINKNLPRNESEKAFIESGLFTMILLDNSEDIQYISNLEPLENEILNFVNEAQSISQRDIIEAKTAKEPADIIDTLRSLDRKGFVLHTKNGIEEYSSIYHYIKN